MASDTRFIEFSSRDDVTDGERNSTFTINLFNTIPEIRERVIGLSLESFSVPNVHPNVSPLTGIGNTIYLTVDGGSTQEIMVPEGYYSAAGLATEIQNLIDSNVELAADNTMIEWLPPPVARFQFTSDSGLSVTEGEAGEDETTLYTSMGYMKNESSAGLAPSLPDLTGLKSVQVHSKQISSIGNHSVDGDGTVSTLIHNIPVNVPWGASQTFKSDTIQPQIYYGHQNQDLDMTTIDFTLLDGNGVPLVVGGSHVNGVLKAWVAPP